MARKKQSLNDAIPIFSQKRRLVYVQQASERSILVKMEKEKFRAVTKHFHLKKWTAAQIKAELDQVHGDTAPTLMPVYFWINEFKTGRTSTIDEARPRCLVEATAPEMIEKHLSHRLGRSPSKGV